VRLRRLPLKYLRYMPIHPKRLFLLDAGGALLTALLLFFVVARLQRVFGMPKNIVYILSAIALVYAVYSFASYLFIKKNWKPFLLVIATANSLYCLATAILLVVYYQQLTSLGFIYFIAEIIIILGLVIIEIRVAGADAGIND
jgi:hypothetical protein